MGHLIKVKITAIHRILLLLTLFKIISCGPQGGEEGSKPKFGQVYAPSISFIKNHATPWFLQNVGPGGSIYICEPNGEKYIFNSKSKEKSDYKGRGNRFLVKEAIRYWLSELGREKVVDVKVLTKCPKVVDKKDAVIKLKYDQCEPESTYLAYASSINWPVLTKTFGINLKVTTIKYCVDKLEGYGASYTEDRFFGTNLHEVGHTFGLCDQYNRSGAKIGDSFNSNCDPRFRTQRSAYSIMNQGSKRREFTDDDRLGARLLACQDTAFMERWAKSHKHIFDSYHDDVYEVTYTDSKFTEKKTFIGELRRLSAQGFKFLDACY